MTETITGAKIATRIRIPMKISEAIAMRSSRKRFQNSRPGDWTGAVKSDSISSAEAPTGASLSSRN